MASLKQEPLFDPTPDPTPLPEPTPLAVATLAEPNPNLDTPSYEPPMGVPLLLATPSVRRLPPPCWTPDETSCLIDSYRHKWYSLRRGNLRAAHWQDVADQIHSQCPDVTPPKTAVQCRHKMEKLRKRYRAELLRAKSLPHHRFSSSWLYFSRMDSMENNTSPSPSPSPAPASAPLLSPQPISQSPSPAFRTHFVQDNDNHVADDGDFTLPSYPQPRTTGFTTPNYQHSDTQRMRASGNNSNRTNSSSSYADFDDSPLPTPNYAFKSTYPPKNATAYPNTFGTGTPQYNGTRFVKNHDINNTHSGSAGMNYVNVNNLSGGGGGGVNKKKRKMDNGGDSSKERGKEKREEAAMEMVDAIRMLGEGFVRMEKMKMEMMRETERMRMEMEMKRTEMLLQSQHRIVEAFAKGWNDVINGSNDHPAS